MPTTLRLMPRSSSCRRAVVGGAWEGGGLLGGLAACSGKAGRAPAASSRLMPRRAQRVGCARGVARVPPASPVNNAAGQVATPSCSKHCRPAADPSPAQPSPAQPRPAPPRPAQPRPARPHQELVRHAPAHCVCDVEGGGPRLDGLTQDFVQKGGVGASCSREGRDGMGWDGRRGMGGMGWVKRPAAAAARRTRSRQGCSRRQQGLAAAVAALALQLCAQQQQQAQRPPTCVLWRELDVAASHGAQVADGANRVFDDLMGALIGRQKRRGRERCG